MLFLLSHLIEQRLINGHEAALAHGGTGLAAELLLWPLQVMEAAAHQLLKPKLLSTYADSTAGDEDDLASFGHEGLDLRNGWHDEYSAVNKRNVEKMGTRNKHRVGGRYEWYECVSSMAYLFLPSLSGLFHCSPLHIKSPNDRVQGVRRGATRHSFQPVPSRREDGKQVRTTRSIFRLAGTFPPTLITTRRAFFKACLAAASPGVVMVAFVAPDLE